MFALLVLDVTALIAGIAVGHRVYPRDYVSFATTTILVALSILIVPIHVAGWFDVLTPPVVIGATATLNVAILAIVLRSGVSLREACARFARRPFEVVREAWRDRSVAAFALVTTYVILVYVVGACWLAPTSSWDGLGYQEAIIGYAIQEQGFNEVVVRPEAFFQQINWVPKGSSYLGIHFGLLSDARLIELPSTLVAPLFLLAGYKMARRHCSRWLAVSLAVGAFLIPGYLLQLRSSYVDSMYASMLAVGLAFLTKRDLQGRDVLVASAAIGWAACFKVTGFFFAPVLMLLLLWRIRGRGLARSAALGIVFALAVGSASYARNLAQFRNPVWPYAVPYVDALGIEVPSPLPDPRTAHSGTLRSFWRDLYSPPKRKKQYADTRDNGYGNGPPFVIFPLAILALITLCGRALDARRRRERIDDSDRTVWLYVLPALLFIATIPVLSWARYSLFSVLIAFVLAGWLLNKLASPSWQEAVAGIVIVTGWMTLGWSDPGWGVKLDAAAQLAGMDTDERFVHQLRVTFQMPEVPAREREALGEGDVFAYSGSRFPASLWNREYSNRVEFIRESGHQQRFDELRPAMVVVERDDYLHRVALAAGFEDLGPTTRLKADNKYRVLRRPR